MQIEEIGSDKKSQGIGGISRQSELRRQAQTMAAEQLASAQAANAGGQAVSNKAELQEDAIKLSTKALNQVATRNSADSLNRRDDLLGSLMDKLNNEILNPDSEFNKQSEKKKKAGKGQGQGQKKKQVKKKAEWEPETKEGQIHPGRDVIGKVRVTTEVKETGGEGGGGSKAVGGVGKSGSSKSNGKSGTPNYGKAAENKGTSNSEQGQKSSDSKDQDKETKELSAAKGLEKSGLKAQGLEQQGKAGKSKNEEQSGEAGAAGGSKVFEVRTRATGTSQSLTVTPPKELKKGDSFRKFRRLDDKPMLKYATMHKKEFQGGDNKQAIKELKKNARAAGESPEAIQQAVQKLKDRTSPDQ